MFALSILWLKMSESGAQPQSQKKRRPLGLSYLIDENPPWYVCLLLGFQVRQAHIFPVFAVVGWITPLLLLFRCVLFWNNSEMPFLLEFCLLCVHLFESVE